MSNLYSLPTSYFSFNKCLTIEDENFLDVDAAEVPSNNAETPNTLGRNLLRGLQNHQHLNLFW